MTAPTGLPPGADDLVGVVGVDLDDEQLFEQKEVAGLSQGQIVRRRFFRHKAAMASLSVLAGIVILSISSVGAGPIPGWWKYKHNTRVPSTPPPHGGTLSLRPTWLGGGGISWGEHPFGLDNELGRDMFAMTMKGVQTTLVIVLVTGLLVMLIGVTVGALSGYFGGWIDSILMRLTEIVIIVPLLVIVSVAAFSFGASGMWSVALVMGLLLWPGLSRLVRAEFLALREREFVDAARVAGASNMRIIFKHILPNSVGVIIVTMTLIMGAAILTEAALGFLGFGVSFPDVSLGTTIELYRTAFSSRPWLFVWPGVFIVAIVLCLQFIGDGLRDAFDPRQKRIPRRGDLERDDLVETAIVTSPSRGSGSLGSGGAN